ncbi:hypothetical protein BJ742DRAFT_769648 [Cladochytrium replicatum]|nr:hypothetical protein BJ742DRAFT_769648 [Cladochytrium replicatum]
MGKKNASDPSCPRSGTKVKGSPFVLIRRVNFGMVLQQYSSDTIEITPRAPVQWCASISLKDVTGATPLYIACSKGHLNIVEKLLGMNALETWVSDNRNGENRTTDVNEKFQDCFLIGLGSNMKGGLLIEGIGGVANFTCTGARSPPARQKSDPSAQLCH